MNKRFLLRLLVAGFCLCLGGQASMAQKAPAAPATPAPAGADDADSSSGGADHQALRLLRQGLTLIEDRQEDRGTKVLTSLPTTFPKSAVRFQAWLALGKYYSTKGDYALGIKNLTPVTEATDASPEEKAEAIYRIGICYYGMADYPRSLSTLRRVTEEYPWSVFANESYYYIGMCHFQLKRWRKVVEALKMVGTSVAPNTKDESLVESGQRFFVKVEDKDLRVLKTAGGSLKVSLTTGAGDQEFLDMAVFDVEGEYYLGSVKMALGTPQLTNGVLEVKGFDTVTAEYVDANTQDGATKVARIGKSRVVSTAVAGFTDGAFREYVHGVFSGQPTFVRVKDYDQDTTNGRDAVKVKLTSRYKLPVEEGVTVTNDETQAFQDRDSIDLPLQETKEHSGLFTGTLSIQPLAEGAAVSMTDGVLNAAEKDVVFLEYMDKEHIASVKEPRKVVAKADFLTGEIPDVWVAQREVSTENLRARKNITEARFYLRLAGIFRDVGLTSRSKEKADTGLEKVDDVIRRSTRMALAQDLVEEAYRIKWELQIAKDDLPGAIATCRQLMSMFPSSQLTDVAMMQIARANLEAGRIREATSILNGILGLKVGPEMKAEAQYLIATTLEKGINSKLSKEERLKAMGQAIGAYKTCAELYPDSPFAGEALGKVIDFHLDARDYPRCLEMIQNVVQDYPDAPFLDEMLLKWGVVLVRVGRQDEAREKLSQVTRDYPNSAAAAKAQKVLELVNK
jgi:TolA-binding protein